MTTTKSDPTKQGWEDSEFPILCQTCLGDNPFVRMTKQNHAKECKVCTRPFTVFRWHPGAGMRYKKTEICQTCSKLKNVCQTCLLDLEFGLPVQVRDTALAIKDDIPRSEVNREYYVQNIESQLTPADSLIDYDKKGDPAGRDMLKKLARPAPYYKRNRPHICSFFVKGECKRGAECPYRHELPLDNELSHQNIKDRYYGHNDPVAKKMLRESEKRPSLKAPSDTTITSLFITGIEEDITESDLRDFFYAFGELKSIVVVYKSKCAFINYESRSAAEAAAAKAFSNLIIKGHNLRANWGRARPSGPRHEQGGDATKAYEASSALAVSGGPPPPPGSGSALYYPSQDSTMQGSRG